MTLSKQEIDHPTSSSSSSTSPTTTVSSDSETRAREDLSGIDSHLASVSSSHVERKGRSDPLTKPTKNPKPNKNEDHDLERGDPLCSHTLEWTGRPPPHPFEGPLKHPFMGGLKGYLGAYHGMAARIQRKFGG